MKQRFHKFAAFISQLSGTATVFVLALAVVFLRAFSGPLFDFSEGWQLFINTFTTITTFLMVFLIQNTQNRESKTMQLKLDELIRATRGRDALVDLEEMTDEELEELNREFHDIREKQATGSTIKRLHQKITIEHNRRSAGRG